MSVEKGEFRPSSEEISFLTPIEELFGAWVEIEEYRNLKDSDRETHSFWGYFAGLQKYSLAMKGGLDYAEQAGTEIDRFLEDPECEEMIDMIIMWYLESKKSGLGRENDLKGVWFRAVCGVENPYKLATRVREMISIFGEESEGERIRVKELAYQAIEELREVLPNIDKFEEIYALENNESIWDRIEGNGPSADDIRKLGWFISSVKKGGWGEVDDLDTYLHNMFREINIKSVDAYVVSYLLEYCLRSDDEKDIKLTKVNMCVAMASQMQDGLGDRDTLVMAAVDGYLKLDEYEKARDTWQMITEEVVLNHGLNSLIGYCLVEGLDYPKLGDYIKQIQEIDAYYDGKEYSRSYNLHFYLAARFLTNLEKGRFFMDIPEILDMIKMGKLDHSIGYLANCVVEWPEKIEYRAVVMSRVRGMMQKYNEKDGEMDDSELRDLLESMIRLKN